MIQSYEDMDVYRKSYALALKVYELSKQMPKEETYGMKSQMRRAAVSVPLNIAEGYGKKESAAEFKRYLMMAKGSCAEVKVVVDFCKDFQYIVEEEHAEMKKGYDEISRMLHKLIRVWK